MKAAAWFLVWYVFVPGDGLIRDWDPVGNEQQCNGMADSLQKILDDDAGPGGFAVVRCERDQPAFPQLPDD